MAIKLEGEGGKALMAWPIVEDFFAALPLAAVCTFIEILVQSIGFNSFRGRNLKSYKIHIAENRNRKKTSLQHVYSNPHISGSGF